MSLSTKILLSIFGLLLIGLGIFFIYKQIDNAKKIDDIQHSIVEQKQLLDNISRAQAQYVSKEDIEAFGKQQDIKLDVIKKDLDGLNAKIVAINGITIISKGQNGTNISSTDTTPRPNAPETDPSSDPFGYMTHTQHLTLNEKFSNVEVPFGSVGFSAWQEKPWDINIAERKYSITSVLGMDQSGRHYSYSKFAIQSGGKTYDVQIDDNKFMEEYPSPSFKLWNPHLFLTAGAGLNVSQTPVHASANAGLMLGIMSYGQYENSPTLSILQLGMGFETETKKPAFILNPFNINIGGILPKGLANNTYIGPSIQLDLSQNIFTGLNLSVGL